MTPIPAVPRATYRLQFNKDFTFADAERIAPYLARLGVSHVYASPYLKARSGSTHGYDIVDHNAFNPEIGDEAAFVSFSDALNRHGLGQILDFVPNHMGIGRADNAWWLDVLEWGEESPYAEYFDIDWNSAKHELRDKVLVPFLGDHYGRVLEAGDLKLGFDAEAGSFSMWYYQHRFPITPGEYPRILRVILGDYRRRQADDQTVIELEDLIVGFRDVGDWSPSIRQPAIRRSEAEVLKQQLRDLVARTPALADAIESTLGSLNERPADPDNLLWAHELLEAQHYRLAYWRVAAEEINYRRFFQINELAGIRIELPTVFEATHRLVLELIRQRRIHGLRIDHIDGLFDPKQYLERLQRRARESLAPPEQPADPTAERPLEQPPKQAAEPAAEDGADALFFVVVEKILAAHEHLREDWPVAGTTGYEFLNRVHGLFLDPAAETSLQRIYERFVGSAMSFEEIAYISKRQVMDFELASELRVLASEYNRMTESSWLTRDYTLVGLRQALREVVAFFPVYRTYVDASGASPQDRRDIEWAIAHARRRSVRADKTVFDFVQAALTTDLSSGPSPYNRREVRRLAMKFQQFTGPVAAKGVEDTAFYRYNRLVSSNEVGGEPTRFGTTVSAFHKITQDAARRWPHAMLSTATHDTKRGEDARVRIDVLSEMPTEWGRRVRRWATLNHRRKVVLNDEPAPTANDEYLFYQALIGSWPVEFHDAAELDPQSGRGVARAHLGLHDQGGPRGEDALELDQPEQRVRRRAAVARGSLPRRLAAQPLPRRLPRLPSPDRRGRGAEQPIASGPQADHARHPRHLSRLRAVGLQPRRSGQSPPGRLHRPRTASRAPRGCLPAAGRRARPRTVEPLAGWNHQAVRDLAFADVSARSPVAVRASVVRSGRCCGSQGGSYLRLRAR